MPGKPLTPEEKLFAVIQGAQAPSPRAKARALPVQQLWKAVATFARPMELPRINRWLLWAAGGLALLCVVNPLILQPKISRVVSQGAVPSASWEIAPPLDGLQPTEMYVQLMQTRDPFRIEVRPQPDQSQQAPPPPPAPPPRPDPHQLIAGLKLVGISWGAAPEVMIEDSSSQQTFILHVGGTVGNAQVKEILQDRVVLRVGDQDVELF